MQGIRRTLACLVAGLIGSLALGGPAAQAASPCQFLPRSAMATASGLPHVAVYAHAPAVDQDLAPDCVLIAWNHDQPRIPARSHVEARRLLAAERAGQLALLSIRTEAGPSLEVLNLGDAERTPFGLPLYGAAALRASGAVLRTSSEVAGAWWWLNPPGAMPEIRRTLILRLTQYHRSFGQLQRELSSLASVAVPRAGGS